MGLPERTDAAEDAFVSAHLERDDVDALVADITLAIDARRPRLAGRLVGLLDDRVEIEPGSALARAQAAARFLVHESTPESRSWSALEDAWQEVRTQRVQRAKQRIRQVARGRKGRIPRVQRGPKRRS